MSFEKRHELALAELARTGMKTRNCFPPMHRLLHRLGVKIRPPHYSSFMNIVAGVTLAFGLGWGLLMHLTLLSDPPNTLLRTLSKSLTAGLLLGWFLALFYRHGTLKYKLTPWLELKESVEAESGDKETDEKAETELRL